MKISRTLATLSAGLVLAFTSFGTAAQAAYPCPVVKFISPYPPGGTPDLLRRLVQPGLPLGLGVWAVGGDGHRGKQGRCQQQDRPRICGHLGA